jgi:uncharacterized protein (DUF58 family)
LKRITNPLTAIGTLALALAIVGYIAGWRLGWIELTVISCACMLALLLALPFVLGRMQLDVERGLAQNRVLVGDQATATFTFHNPRSTPVRGRELLDLVTSVNGDWKRHHPVKVPALGSGGSASDSYQLPKLGRGRYLVGPAVVSRADPLQLMRRQVAHTEQDTLWVHPRYDPVAALPVGFAKDLEGPTSETSPVGDVAFHSLREYSPGDDFRHIHWMSTARANRPMVRHYVDNRRPHLAVLLDNGTEALGPDEFEIAVEIVASLAVSSFLHREPIAVWAGDEALLGRGAAGDRDTVLDQLATVQQAGRFDARPVAAALVRTEHGVSAMVYVTGGVASADLLPMVREVRRRARVVVVRVWSPGASRHQPVPGAHVIDIETRSGFVAAWLGFAK